MATELWKSIGQAGPMLSKLSEVVGEFGGWMNVLGIMRKRNAPPTEPKSQSGTETISENKVQEGELYALLAWLSTIHMDDTNNSRCILEYRAKRTELHVFPKLVDALPPGAVKRLMQTVAVEVTTVKRKKTTGFTQHKDSRDPSKSKQTPITSEWDDKLNLKGQQVIGALTWLVMNQGSDTEDKRIAAIAKTLQSLRILDNLEDKTAAGTRAAKDKADEVWAKLKDWYGDYDSRVHVFLATVATNRETVNRILSSPEAIRLMAAIEAAPAEQKRQCHEAFQAFLLQRVREIQNPDSPAIARHQAREAGQSTPEERARKDVWLTKLLIGIIIGGLIVLGVAAKLNLNP